MQPFGRDDWRLDNLTIFSEGNPPPPLDSRGLKGYRTPWVEMFLLRGRPKDREAYNRCVGECVRSGAGYSV